MFTYQIRRRAFHIESGASLVFPNPVEILIVLGPPQPFGMESEGGRTATQSVAATVWFNANTGQHFVISKKPFEPLDLTIQEPGRRWELRGNELRVSIEICASNPDLTDLIESLYYGLPLLLNVEFADPPVVERVEGKVGDTEFRWELADWRMMYAITTQEEQERHFADSLQRFELLSQQDNRRLIAALHYFHMSCRLTRSGHTPWEFMAESILNLCKTLEVLFPSPGASSSRDAVRQGLAALEYSDEEIERYFLPAMALRNEIDVGHVDLSLYTRRQLHALHSYTEAAELAFQKMLQRLLQHMNDGRYVLSPYVARSSDSTARGVIERLEKFFGEDISRRSPD